MLLTIDINDLDRLTENFSYHNDGDLYEIKAGHLVNDHFPNSEIFWKKFVTPITNRVDSNLNMTSERIRPRKSISTDLVDISIIHYSVFMNLIYARQCLETKHISFFENFYAHLGSVCDLAEEFLIQIYFVTLECEEKQTEILQKLSEAQFLDLAKTWYDKHYQSSFDHYLKKGKIAPFKIIGRSNILEEYFSKSSEWIEYSNLALLIRTYRNVIVHNTLIGCHVLPEGVFVPRKNKISDYKKWNQVFAVTKDQFKLDFVQREKQMNDDLTLLKTALNKIWSAPIEKFKQLLFVDRNPKIISKYGINHQTTNGVKLSRGGYPHPTTPPFPV